MTLPDPDSDPKPASPPAKPPIKIKEEEDDEDDIPLAELKTAKPKGKARAKAKADKPKKTGTRRTTPRLHNPITVYPDAHTKRIHTKLSGAGAGHSLHDLRAWLPTDAWDENGRLTRLGLVASTYLTCAKLSEAGRALVVANGEIVIPRGSTRRSGTLDAVIVCLLLRLG